MEKKFLGSTGLAKFLENLYDVFSQVGHTHTRSQITDFPTIPTKVSQLDNDSGFVSTDNNTTYTLTKDGSTITLAGTDGSSMSIDDSDTIIAVDSELSNTSDNPVQNKVIKSEFDAISNLVGDTKVADQITEAIAGALKIDGVDKYALASDLTAAIVRIATMESNIVNWDAAEQNAKDYADGLNSAINTRVEGLEAIDHEHENIDILNGITEEEVAAWGAAQANAEATAAASLASAKTELEGRIVTETDRAVAAEVKVLSDATAYADGLADNYDKVGAATTAETNAKAYADSLVMTWGSF